MRGNAVKNMASERIPTIVTMKNGRIHIKEGLVKVTRTLPTCNNNVATFLRKCRFRIGSVSRMGTINRWSASTKVSVSNSPSWVS